MNWHTLLLASTLVFGVLSVVAVLAAVRFGPLGGRFIMPRLSLPGDLGVRLTSTRLGLQVHVDPEGGGAVAGVGRLAARSLFPAARFPRFTVRTFSAFARPSRGRPGGWADPAAPLYALRFGAWEVEAEAALWRQPFGYRDDGRLDPETLVRLVKADWNYFTAYAWGVPLDAVAACDRLEGAAIHVAQGGRVRVGERGWDRLLLDGVDVAAPGLGQDGRRPVAPDALVAALWRFGLGVAPPAAVGPSFAPVRLRLRLRISHRSSVDEDRGRLHHTAILFAAARDDDPGAEALLDRQERGLDEAAALLAGFGFPGDPPVALRSDGIP